MFIFIIGMMLGATLLYLFVLLYPCLTRSPVDKALTSLSRSINDWELAGKHYMHKSRRIVVDSSGLSKTAYFYDEPLADNLRPNSAGNLYAASQVISLNNSQRKVLETLEKDWLTNKANANAKAALSTVKSALADKTDADLSFWQRRKVKQLGMF